ncbi:hypothetical protein GW750_02110 [bacterium]|nr:hypothetical protein [bacterium]
MKYELLNNDQGIGLVQRLLSIRNISDDIQNFLYPSFETYRQDPFDLHDMDKGVTRFVSAMKSKERIMIFGDYDVD